MKIRVMVAMVGAILVGYFLGKVVFDGTLPTEVTFYESGSVFFLQEGVYSSKEAMEKEVEDLDQYLYRVEDGKYCVYLGVTSKKENAEKVQQLYQEEGKSIYIKEQSMNNQDFLSNLVQYDILLSSSNTKQEIESVLKAILASYREFVLEIK